jgi:hypothetical protein
MQRLLLTIIAVITGLSVFAQVNKDKGEAVIVNKEKGYFMNPF